MNIKSLNTLLIAASVLSFAACNKENGLEQAHQDRSLSFELSMAAVSHDTDESGASTKSLEIKSADGSIVLPMEYRVTDGIGESLLVGEVQTKGEQINYNTQLQTIGSFKVKAWNSDHSSFLPTDDSEESTVNYTNEKWTLQEETAPLWKNADVKTFLAYSNLPDGAEVTFTGETSQLFSYPALQLDAKNQKDALLGYYWGSGDSDGDGVSDGVAKIQFIHPLTAVVFKQGNFVGNITAIKSLSLEGVYDGGEAVVSYSYNTGDDLVPVFDWGSSRSATTTVSQTGPDSGALPVVDKKIGEPFIILPQNLSTDKVTIKAIVTVAGVNQEIIAELNTGEWKAGKTNTYTINYDAHTYTYKFTLEEDETSGMQIFNTYLSDEKDVTIINTKTDDEGAEQPGEWLIKSVQVGSGEVVSVDDTSFEDIGGISASKQGDNTLHIVSTERSPLNPSTHEHWVGDNGAWSPVDWSTTKATTTSPLDLSKFNFQNESTDNPMSTANCYIIRHAGTYKLPLVYGNAIVNGAFNERSYCPYPDEITYKSQRLNRFQNHIQHDDLDTNPDKGIISPFIEYNTTDGLPKSESNEYLAPASGTGGYEIVWQDKADIITVNGISKEEVTVKNASGVDETFNVSYITFTIPQDDICQNNALITVKDGSGNIMWSWHIWTTNDPALISGPIDIENFDGNHYNLFPLNVLGWLDKKCYPAREDVKMVLLQKGSGETITLTVKQNFVPSDPSNGCWYQFGRKDPMCSTDSPAQGEFNKLVSTEFVGSLAYSILHPNTFVKGAIEPPYWSGNRFNNLWTGIYNDYQDNKLFKTVYDPSPVGYKMPGRATFTGFTTDGTNVTGQPGKFNIDGEFKKNVGLYFYTVKSEDPHVVVHHGTTPTVFFPVPGRREFSTGNIQLIGTHCQLWLAVPGGDTYGTILNVQYNQVEPYVSNNNNNSSYAMAVRPVQE